MGWIRNIWLIATSVFAQAAFADCAHNTLVFDGKHLIPIQHLCKNVSLVSFTSNWKFVATKVKYIATPHVCEQLLKVTLEGNESVTVQRHQKFLLFDTHEWTCAHNLTPGSRLVRIGSEPCLVTDVYEAPEDYTYEIDVGVPHTFFITRWCILTHNTDLSLVMTTVTTDGILASVAGTSFCTTLVTMLTSCGIKATLTCGTLSLTAPISGPFVVAACAGACMGYVFYRAYDWWKGFLSISRVTEVITCAEQVKSSIVEQVQTGYQEQDQFRDKHNAKDNKKISHKNGNQTATGGGSQDPKDPKKRNTDKVGNIHELFKRDGFGKQLKENSEPTKQSYKGAKIYRVTKNMPEHNLQKGDLFYLDSLHFDHIEVYRGSSAYKVIDLEGQMILAKTLKAYGREI